MKTMQAVTDIALSFTCSLLSVGLGAAVGTITSLWAFESFSEFAYTVIGVTIVVFLVPRLQRASKYPRNELKNDRQ